MLKRFHMTTLSFLASSLALNLGLGRADSLSILDAPLTSREEALEIAPSKADLLDQMRESVRTSPYGQRGLDRVFKNFEGDYYLDPTIPGVTKNVRLLDSPSWQQAKGAMRELVYATAVHNDPRFELVHIGKPVSAEFGRTDKDLFFRHRMTGQMCRIEVKDVSLSSQRSDIVRLKRQIDLMADEYERTGELQALVNRQEILPEIADYARSKNVRVYSAIKQREFGNVLDDFAGVASWKANLELIGGVAEGGFGIVLLANEGPKTVQDINDVWSSGGSETRTWLSLGYDASLTGVGSSMTFAGATSLTARMVESSPEWLASAEVLSKWGGPVGLGLYVVAEGFDEGINVWDYRHGNISRERFISKSTGGGTGLGFTVAGAIVGTFIEPGGGTLAGAGIGALLGVPASIGSTYLVDSHYSHLNAVQRDQILAAIYNHYGVQ